MAGRDGRRRAAHVLAAATAILGGGVVAASTTAPATRPAPDTTVVHRGTLRLSFDADAVFEPVDPFEVRLAFRHYAGELIVRKAVAANATVAKGDVLLALDTDPIDRQIAAADSACAVAKANAAKADADVSLGDKADALAMDQAKQSLADADAGLKRWDQTDGPATVLAGGLEATQADDAVDNAADELNQLRQMYKSEDLTSQTADIVLKRAVRSMDLAKASDQVAKAAADRATTYAPAVHRHGLTANVAAQAAAVEQLQASQAQARVVRAAALTAARAAAAEADRTLVELKRDRAALTVTSPIDGVVVFGAFAHKAWQPVDPKRFAVDQKVQPETVLMTVYQPGKLRAVVACPESRVTRLPPGTRVTVAPVALPGATYDGPAGPAAAFATGDTAQATVDVPVTLPAVDRQLAPGYAATVAVDVPPAAGVLLVPASAVWHGRAVVHAADGQDQPRPVTLGRTDGKQVEIRSGLKDGDVVLTLANVPTP